MDKVALISDIHGNMPALEAVLTDIRQRGIELIYNLGDLVGKGPYSDQVVDRTREVCQVVLRGNWDDAISTETGPVAAWHGEQLGEARLDYLRSLPNSHDFRMSGKAIRLYHASSTSEHHRVHPGSGEAALFAMFENTPFTGFDAPCPEVVGYGDIHGVYLLPLEGQGVTKTLFNVGSVGNPLDLPQAAYVVLSGVLGSADPAPFAIDFVRLPYDVEAVVEQSRRIQQPEYQAFIVEVRTAVYRRRQPPASSASPLPP
jgi:protein phosphatase